MISIIMQKLNVDQKIRSTFGLFSGLRSEDEDRRIYGVVSDGVSNETINFMEENGKINLESVWKRPELVAQLNARLNYYLSRLVYESRKLSD